MSKVSRQTHRRKQWLCYYRYGEQLTSAKCVVRELLCGCAAQVEQGSCSSHGVIKELAHALALQRSAPACHGPSTILEKPFQKAGHFVVH